MYVCECECIYGAFHNVLRDYKFFFVGKPYDTFLRNLYRQKEYLKIFFPVICFSSQFTFLPLGDACICSEKMAAPGEKSFCVLEYHTASLWLLCNVHFVQSTHRTRLQTRQFVRGINSVLKLGVCAIRYQVFARLPLKNLNILPMCAESPAVHNRSSLVVKKKNFFSFPVAVNNSIKLDPVVFLL